MALNTASYKSIGAIIGVALAGVIFVTATVLWTNRDTTPEVTTAPFSEPVSGLVFDAPKAWTVGTTSTSNVQIRALRLEDIQTQRSTCTQFDESVSKSIADSLGRGPHTATEAWQKEFAGLTASRSFTSTGGVPVLVGVDTCNPSLTTKLLTLRGQAYKKDIEVRFSVELEQPEETSQQALKEMATALTLGTGPLAPQNDYNQFLALMTSLR